jgi:hypothetical protein
MVMVWLLRMSRCGAVKLWGRTTEPAPVSYDFHLSSRSTQNDFSVFSERRLRRRLYLEPTDHWTGEKKSDSR